MTPQILSANHERGFYIVWDTTSWRKDRVSPIRPNIFSGEAAEIWQQEINVRRAAEGVHATLWRLGYNPKSTSSGRIRARRRARRLLQHCIARYVVLFSGAVLCAKWVSHLVSYVAGCVFTNRRQRHEVIQTKGNGHSLRLRSIGFPTRKLFILVRYDVIFEGRGEYRAAVPDAIDLTVHHEGIECFFCDTRGAEISRRSRRDCVFVTFCPQTGISSRSLETEVTRQFCLLATI
jgi:hypothetical protein